MLLLPAGLTQQFSALFLNSRVGRARAVFVPDIFGASGLRNVGRKSVAQPTGLLNNAAKYTPPGGRITLSITTQERKALVRVQDTGIGIPVSMQERVFDLFTQVDPSVEKSQGGLGIGLSLVKRLVELHGGTVEAHSKGDGLGSEFVVRLPVWQSACLQEQDAVIQKAVANSPAARRILIADDNADASASLAMLLGMLGHEVYTVKDGQEAVEVAAKRRPELILLDLNMPRLNGYEACRRLRTDSWGKNTIIVALTGLGQDQDLQASRAAGFDHHIVKPVDLVELERLLETLPNADVHLDN